MRANTTPENTKNVNPYYICTQQHKNNFPAMEKNGETTENVKGIAQQTTVAWGGKTQPLKTPRMWISSAHSLNQKHIFPAVEWGTTKKTWREEPSNSNCMREKNIWVHHGMGLHSQAFTCPRSQRHVFQKWVAPQIWIWLPYSSHPHALTNSTTSRRNKWLGTKNKMGSWQFDGFSPLAQRF